MAYALQPRSVTDVRLASGADILAGLWLFISAFFVPSFYGLMWSNAICGIIVVVLAAIRAGMGRTMDTRLNVLSWLNMLVGLWVLISPWILAYSPSTATIVCNVVTGLVIILLSASSAMASNNVGTEDITHHDTLERDEHPMA